MGLLAASTSSNARIYPARVVPGLAIPASSLATKYKVNHGDKQAINPEVTNKATEKKKVFRRPKRSEAIPSANAPTNFPAINAEVSISAKYFLKSFFKGLVACFKYCVNIYCCLKSLTCHKPVSSVSQKWI